MIFTEIRAWLEILYFLGGITIGIASIIALNQLKISKVDIDIRARRESATETAHQCDRFADVILPIISEIMRFFSQNKIPQYNGPIKDFIVKTEPDVLNWIKKNCSVYHDKEIMTSIIKALNLLESFSIYFIHGICDENIAFNPIASAFLDTVRTLYPCISCKHEENETNYSNIIALYNIWSKKKEKISLDKKGKCLLEDLIKINETATSIEVPNIKPIGIDKNKK